MLIKWLKRKSFAKLLNNLNISNIDALSGLEFEKFVCKLFDYLGYKSVLTKQSGDNGVDIIANAPRISLGIQSKLYYNHSVGNKAIQEVYSGSKFYNLTNCLVITWIFSILVCAIIFPN